ncbi:MAG: amidohydrolase family protein [Chloroflexi bacterium]|nr:amidohydrolase family protein [Chloroflexota bacterium]
MKVFKGATLVDGTGRPPVQNAIVVVAGDRVQAAGPAASPGESWPPGAEVIDASGMTLLPGLIDCHDHLAFFGYEFASRWGVTEPRSLRHMRIAAVLGQTLETGYTAVRDAGGLDAGFKQAVQEGLVPGPRLHVSLSIISPTGGIGDTVSPSGHGSPVPPDPSLPSGVANGPEGMRLKVREMVRAGADVIKFAVTGGAASRRGFGPKDMLISREEIEALVDEAHGLGRRAMCHALGGPGLRAAIEAGVDSIEHGSYMDEDPDLLDMMARKSIFFVPTFSVYIYHGERGTPHGRERAADLRRHHVESLRLALRAGVKVVAGTDAGGWVHGNNAQELTCLVGSGMTPAQAIVAATGHAAQCLGLEADIGTVAPGKKADLVLVEGDPLKDISTLERGKSVRLVMKDGQVYLDRR